MTTNDDNTQPLAEIADLFSQIQRHMKGFCGESGGILYLFFALRMTLSEISQIFQVPPQEVRRVVANFLEDLLAKSHSVNQLLSRLKKENELPDVVVTFGDAEKEDLITGANLIITTCETPDSVGDRLRDTIGAAIRISLPPESPAAAQVLSKLILIEQEPKRQTVKFPIRLEEKDFFLGRERIAAGPESLQVAKTSSDGIVIVERGTEKVEVSFHIVLQKGPLGEYAIAFDNLPKWATPTSFSFVVDDGKGGVKEYELPAEFRENTLYIKVADEEHEMAFLDRKEAYIGFIIGE